MARTWLPKEENWRGVRLAAGSKLWVSLIIVAAVFAGGAFVLFSGSPLGGALPGGPELTIVSPRSGHIVGAALELQVRTNEITQDIQILVMDEPGIYRYAGRIAVSPTGQAQLLTRLLDSADLGKARAFRLVVISTNGLSTRPGGVVDESAIPSSVPRHEIELRHAGVIISPAPKDQVAAEEIVEVQGFLIDSYMAAVLRPASEGGYWVQNDGILASPTTPIPIRVQFGGRSVYHLYIGITYDRELFRRGDRYDRFPATDHEGKPVYWIGPIELVHK